MVLFINPGDTVTWTNMAGHDTTSLDGMIPEGAEKWQSKMGEVFSVTFDKEGAYVYKCTPHVSLGMLGAIIVGDGDPENLEQITGHPDNKGMIKRVIRKMTQALDKR
jgi:pseudoazurin